LSRKKWTLVVCLLLGLVVLNPVRPVKAAELFSLSALPGRVVEGYTSGVRLVLFVSNAQIGAYVFNFTVQDPSGKSTFVTKNTPSTTTSWNLTAIYPSDFSASLNLVGTYSVNVAEVAPAVNPTVARTTFQVGLTDSQTYQRNSIVQVTGTGYVPLDTVTVNMLLGSTNAPGFPRTVAATTGGVVSVTWQTYPNTPAGNYVVSLTGMSSPAKTPPDAQLFSLIPTNTTTLRLLTSLNTILRTQTLAFAFNATYLNGTPAATGSAQLRLTEPDGVTLHVITATYNTTQQSFTAFYTSSLASPTGTWTVTLNKDAFNDTNGNNGPPSAVGSTFGIGTAILTISNQLTTATYSAGNIIPIVSRVQTPSGANFVQGTVTAMITSSGRGVTSPISLVFDQTQGEWIGSYKVDASDPSGTWLLTVQAQDPFGNSGGTTSSFTVNTPGPPNPIVISLTMWAWLIAVLLAVGLGFAILIFRQRNVSHREVKLDLTAIHSKAEEVKSDNFLQSIKTQLKRRTDVMAEDKNETGDKHD
jgi:hypothetical protein